MSSEALAEKRAPAASAPDRDDRGRPDAGPWEQCFDLAPGRSTPVRDRGSRHLYHSLAEMLAPVVLDARALADRPLRALVLGCDEGYLAHRLLGWDVEHVLAVDSRPDALDRARFIRGHRAISPERLELRRCAAASDLGLAVGDVDLVIADGRTDRLGDRPGALDALAGVRAMCALIAPGRLQAAAALNAAGYPKPTLLEPPADAERRLIAHELCVMLAPPPEGEAG